jgi:uncharacterized protein (DUF1684 family)
MGAHRPANGPVPGIPAAAVTVGVTPAAHREQVFAWWRARDDRLRSPDGWLTLVGLHWLVPGDNTLGSAPDNDLFLRFPDVPAQVGVLHQAETGVSLRRPGHGDQFLQPDVSGEPTVLAWGSLHAHLIQRADRFALRVRDHASPVLARFTGMDHFPLDASWRLQARFEGAASGATVELMDVTGTLERAPTPGSVTFQRGGTEWRLTALPGGEDGSLWLVFADGTSGHATYGGGRFLYTEPVSPDGSVVVDFNLAYNPPCVFTPYATCPLPPPENRLSLRIEAGELDYAGHEA